MEFAGLAEQVWRTDREVGDSEPGCQGQRLLVRRPRLRVAVQARLDVAERQVGARALGILGDELLCRGKLAAGVILESFARDLNLQLLRLRSSWGEALGSREVGLEFVERVAGVGYG